MLKMHETQVFYKMKTGYGIDGSKLSSWKSRIMAARIDVRKALSCSSLSYIMIHDSFIWRREQNNALAITWHMGFELPGLSIVGQ